MSNSSGDPWPPYPYPFPAWPFYTAPNTGWICPRCNVVHAPTVQQCHCNVTTPQGPTCLQGGGEPPPSR